MYPIPANATRIRYLEGVSGGYIVLPWAFKTTDRWDMDAQFTNVSSQIYNGGYYNFKPIGASANIERLDVAAVESSSGKFRINYGTGNDLQAKDTDRHLFVLDALNKNCKIDSTTYSLSGTHVNVPDTTPYLGILGRIIVSSNGSYSLNIQGTGCRVFASRLYRNNVLGMDLIPVRVGQTGYLFDRVSGQLFGNAGTGDFVLGPDTFSQGVVPTRMMAMGVRKKLPYDAEVEYLESTGTQYIDTGYCSCEHSHIVIDTTFQSSAGSSCFFGTRTSNIGTGSSENLTLSAFVNGSGNCAINDYKYDSGWLTNKPALVAGGRYRIEILNRSLYVNNTLYVASPTTAIYTSDVSLGLFRLKQRNGFQTETNRPLAGRIWSFRVDEGGVLFRDMTPVRVGSVGYLYDRANPTGGPLGNGLYGSETANPLVAGPDKIPS